MIAAQHAEQGKADADNQFVPRVGDDERRMRQHE
jgi:hypothetical protein